jgi:hypothetical protein
VKRKRETAPRDRQSWGAALNHQDFFLTPKTEIPQAHFCFRYFRKLMSPGLKTQLITRRNLRGQIPQRFP